MAAASGIDVPSAGAYRRLLEVGISTGEPVKLFFTEYHVDYWLKQAPDRSGAA